MNNIAPDNEIVSQLANRSTGVQTEKSEMHLWRNVCVSEQHKVFTLTVSGERCFFCSFVDSSSEGELQTV